MKIGAFIKAKGIYDELSTLKIALSVMNGFDDCGMSPTFDISALPKTVKEKIKPMISDRIEELENEFEQLSESED